LLRYSRITTDRWKFIYQFFFDKIPRTGGKGGGGCAHFCANIFRTQGIICLQKYLITKINIRYDVLVFVHSVRIPYVKFYQPLLYEKRRTKIALSFTSVKNKFLQKCEFFRAFIVTQHCMFVNKKSIFLFVRTISVGRRIENDNLMKSKLLVVFSDLCNSHSNDQIKFWLKQNFRSLIINSFLQYKCRSSA
jgi:hypothetical protein